MKRMRQFLTGWIMLVCAISLVLPVFFGEAENVGSTSLEETQENTLVSDETLTYEKTAVAASDESIISVVPTGLDSSVTWTVDVLNQNLESGQIVAITDTSGSWALWPEEQVAGSNTIGLVAREVGNEDGQLSLADACVWHLKQVDGKTLLFVVDSTTEQPWYLVMGEAETAGEAASVRLTADAEDATPLFMNPWSPQHFIALGSNAWYKAMYLQLVQEAVDAGSTTSDFVAYRSASGPQEAGYLKFWLATASNQEEDATASEEAQLIAEEADVPSAQAKTDLISVSPQLTGTGTEWRLKEVTSGLPEDGAVLAITDSSKTYALWPTMMSDGTYTGLQAVNLAATDDPCIWHVERVGDDRHIRLYVLDSNQVDKDGIPVRWYLHMAPRGGGLGDPGDRSNVYLSREAGDDSQLLFGLSVSTKGLCTREVNGSNFGNPWYEGTFLERATDASSFVATVRQDHWSAERLRYWVKSEVINYPTVDTVLPSNASVTLFDYWITGQTMLDDVPDNAESLESGINVGHGLKFLRWGYGEDNWNARVQNYGGPANVYTGVSGKNDGFYSYKGTVKRNLVDGSPVLSGDNLSGDYKDQPLDYLFDADTDEAYRADYAVTDGLFQLGSDGYYTYDSEKNYAEYVDGSGKSYADAGASHTGTLKVYDASAVYPSTSTATQGQFFPFNTYGDVAGANSQAWQLNHYFGMHMTLDFSQIDAGKGVGCDANGQPRVFEFQGDDDVWIYVDGVLVADLGGLHNALSTTINLATGEVTESGSNGGRTTLRDLFEAGFREANPTKTGIEIAEYLASIFGDGDTFVEGSQHKLDFFYMERGNSDSNLKLKFNLVRVSEPAVKKVDETGKAMGGVQFTLTGCDDKGNTNGSSISGTTDPDTGVWSLINQTTKEPYTYGQFVAALGDATYALLEEVAVPAGYGSSLIADSGVILRVTPMPGTTETADGSDGGVKLEAVGTKAHVVTKSGEPTYVTCIDSKTGTTVVVMNHPNTLSIEKIDDAGTPLANAVFTLTNNATGAEVTATSADKTGIATFTKIPIGTYTLSETSAPKGYIATTETWTVDVTQTGVTVTGKDQTIRRYSVYLSTKTKAPITEAERDGNVTSQPISDSVALVTSQSFTVKNSRILSLSLIKVNYEKDKGLSGRKDATLMNAVFTLQRIDVESGAVEYTTDVNGSIDFGSLALGATYRLRETASPDGYALPNDAYVVFTVSSAGVLALAEEGSGFTGLITLTGPAGSGGAGDEGTGATATQNSYTLVVGNKPNGFTLPNAGGVDRARVVNVFLAIIFALMGVTRLCKAMNAESRA